MKAERLILWCNRIIKCQLIWYVLGFFTPIVIAFAMHHYGFIRDSEKIISEWRISEQENGKVLFVQPVSLANGCFLIDVTREPNDKTWKEVSVTRVSPKEKKDFVFLYKKDDAVTYGSSNRMFWRDFNCDGQFDLRTDTQKKLTEIYVEDQWIKVHYDNKQAKTDEGLIYKFDVSAGEWKTVKSNGVNEKS